MIKLRCSICDQLVLTKETMMIFYNKKIHIAVCKVHKEVIENGK